MRWTCSGGCGHEAGGQPVIGFFVTADDPKVFTSRIVQASIAVKRVYATVAAVSQENYDAAHKAAFPAAGCGREVEGRPVIGFFVTTEDPEVFTSRLVEASKTVKGVYANVVAVSQETYDAVHKAAFPAGVLAGLLRSPTSL